MGTRVNSKKEWRRPDVWLELTARAWAWEDVASVGWWMQPSKGSTVSGDTVRRTTKENARRALSWRDGAHASLNINNAAEDSVFPSAAMGSPHWFAAFPGHLNNLGPSNFIGREFLRERARIPTPHGWWKKVEAKGEMMKRRRK